MPHGQRPTSDTTPVPETTPPPPRTVASYPPSDTFTNGRQLWQEEYRIIIKRHALSESVLQVGDSRPKRISLLLPMSTGRQMTTNGTETRLDGHDHL